MSYPNLSRLLLPLLLLWALVAGGAGVAGAHPANVAGGRAKIAADGTFVVNARFDILAYIIGQTPLKVADAPMDALLDGPPENLKKALATAQARFAREMVVKADNGAGTLDSVKFPTLAQVQEWRDSGIPPRLPVMLVVEVKGHLPPGARTVSFGFPPVLGTFVFTEEIQNQEPFTQPLDDGALSTPLSLFNALPTPTPQKPGDSPAALYKPKPKKTAAPTKKSAPKKAASAKPAPKPARKTIAAASVGAMTSPRPPAPPKPNSGGAPTSPRATAPTIVAPKVASPKVVAPKVAAPAKFAGQPQKSAVSASPAPSAIAEKPGPNLPKPRGAVTAAPLNPGEASAISDKIKLSPKESAPRTGANASEPERAELAPAELPQAQRRQMERPTWFSLFGYFVAKGYTHILPGGLDHILFVLGLFLLGSQLPALVKQITAFTVAHSLTLALAASGRVHLPSALIEPLIALSIVFVAVENLSTTEVRPWRIFVVFGFGLVHGLGFAEVFENLGLSGSNFLTALFGFNLGVEFGQLSVVAAALLAVGWFRKRESYRKFVVVPGSLAIAAVAAFWTLQRVFFEG